MSPVTATTATAIKPGLYEDVTARVGIDFQHTNGTGTRFFLTEITGGGCAFLDYDDDGLLDVLLLSPGNFHTDGSKDAGPNLALYRNKGSSVFENVTQGSGLETPLGYAQGVAVGDYDNDGYPDIFVAGYRECHLFHNTGSGPSRRASAVTPGAAVQPQAPANSLPRFEDVTRVSGLSDTDTSVRWATGGAWHDYDKDGKLDLFILHYAVWSPEKNVICPRPDGRPDYCAPVVLPGDTSRLLHNEGGGRFRDVTHAAGIDRARGRGLAACWTDYDEDGWPDLYVANDMDPNLLFRNNGNGTFTEAGVKVGVAYGADGVAHSGMGIAAGDDMNAGRESLFVTNLNGEVYSLFRNQGGGNFTYVSDRAGIRAPTLARSGWGTSFLDFDRDGWLDLITANGHVNPFLDNNDPGVRYKEPMSLFRNDGKGAFQDLSAQGGAIARERSTRGLAVGDFDNDGRVDVLCISRNDKAELFRNVSPDMNHWLSLRLVGTRSNRDGAGARVTVKAGSIRRSAWCRLGSSYASSSDKRLHFGLGAASMVDSIEIEWPSGQRDVFRSVAADRFYDATEGKGCVPAR